MSESFLCRFFSYEIITSIIIRLVADDCCYYYYKQGFASRFLSLNLHPTSKRQERSTTTYTISKTFFPSARHGIQQSHPHDREYYISQRKKENLLASLDLDLKCFCEQSRKNNRPKDLKEAIVVLRQTQFMVHARERNPNTLKSAL